MISGYATAAGTERYRDRHPSLAAAGHFRRPESVPGWGELWISSLGLGTYLGQPDDASDRSYTEAAACALASGINLLDAAINYRHQRSERALGAALSGEVAAGRLQRDEVIVCTKAGYLSFDGSMPADPRAYFMREYVDPGILDPRQIVGGMHCMAPRFLADQLDRCRRNLGLETIDVFYLHNPETQIGALGLEPFYQRLAESFTFLEQAVGEGKIRCYGCATWNAFRLPPGQGDGLSLSRVLEAARQAGGAQHHFRVIQLPFNLQMTEAYGFRNQEAGEAAGKELVSTLELAAREGVAVVGSASLYQGQLAAGLPAVIGQALGMERDWENAIQFARSTPGLAAALIGMSRKTHVEANLKVAAHPPASPEKWKSLFSRD
ncbi:MAG: aldo/keto reductase [Terriglobales bacterium]